MMYKRQEGINMKTVIYARKSRGTIEELNNQISICKEYCNKNNYEIAEVFAEIKSSQDFEREQYKALKNYIKENTNVRIIVSHADRLNRNLIQQAKLNELLLKTSSYIEVVGSGIIKLDTPENQMMSNIINSFNQYNYQLIRHKMMTGLHNFQERGGKVGSTPIGFVRADKYHYVLDMEKCDIIRQIFKDIAEGVSTKEVADKLEQINFRSSNDKKLGTREVRNIVRNEVYYKNNPQIVSKELWLEANSQLRSILNSGKKSYPLSNKIVCSKCGTPLIIGFKNDRGCSIVNSCNTSNSIRGKKTKCDCMGSRLDLLENLVISDCKAHIENRLAELYQQLTEDKKLLSSHEAELQATQAEIAANKDKLSKLNTLFILDNISQEELKEQSAEIKDKISLMELKLNRLESYSLFKIAEELQEKIIRLEELKESNNINDLVNLVDHVEYYKDQSSIQVKTVFKE